MAPMTVSGQPESPNDMRRMQQEAVRRVQDMQARARNAAQQNRTAQPGPPNRQTPGERHQPSSSSREERRTESEAPAPLDAAASNTANLPASDGKIPNLLDSLLQDSERTLILLLILLLMEGEAETDTGLLLALMYLII